MVIILRPSGLHDNSGGQVVHQLTWRPQQKGKLSASFTYTSVAGEQAMACSLHGEKAMASRLWHVGCMESRLVDCCQWLHLPQHAVHAVEPFRGCRYKECSSLQRPAPPVTCCAVIFRPVRRTYFYNILYAARRGAAIEAAAAAAEWQMWSETKT